MPHNKLKKLTLRAGEAAFYQYDPKIGFWGIPNIERDVCFPGMNNNYVRVRHNKEGNRDKNFEKEGTEGFILCIGGSHTWGGGVEQDARYTDYLENMIGRPVYNLGHCSLGLDQICLAILEKSAYYHPSVIIVEQYPWAIHRVLNTYVNGYTRPYFYLDVNGDLKLQKMSPLSRYKVWRRIIGSFYSYRKELEEFNAGINLKEGYDPWADPIFLYWKLPYYEYMYNLVDKIVVVMHEYCRQNGIKILFGLGAIMQQFGKSSPSALIDYNLPRKRIMDILEKNRIACIDMTDAMMAEHKVNDPVIFPDGHMNKKGHQVFAKEIAKELEARKWISA